jgi:hypothetical protein
VKTAARALSRTLDALERSLKVGAPSRAPA